MIDKEQTLGQLATAVPAAAKVFYRDVLRRAARPRSMLRRQHLQSVLIIQPIDLGPDGRDNMCDGCPDMTVHEGKLVWSCRLEEWRKFGEPLRAVPLSMKGPAAPG